MSILLVARHGDPAQPSGALLLGLLEHVAQAWPWAFALAASPRIPDGLATVVAWDWLLLPEERGLANDLLAAAAHMLRTSVAVGIGDDAALDGLGLVDPLHLPEDLPLAAAVDRLDGALRDRLPLELTCSTAAPIGPAARDARTRQPAWRPPATRIHWDGPLDREALADLRELAAPGAPPVELEVKLRGSFLAWGAGPAAWLRGVVAAGRIPTGVHVQVLPGDDHPLAELGARIVARALGAEPPSGSRA